MARDTRRFASCAWAVTMSEMPSQTTGVLPEPLNAGIDRRGRAIPVLLTPCIGREAEIGRILALLDNESTRLLTLTGPGGVGKTRLALEVSAAVEADFADGARFVPLASIRDPDLIPFAVARACG